jgi:ribose 1,5-bisphosphokinase
MTAGRFIAVVGPSGVGKDSVMAGLAAQAPFPAIARRVITRPAELGGEDFEAVSVETFAARRDAGQFVLHWGAHGLFYGIPRSVEDQVGAGQDMLMNLSRTVLGEADVRLGRFVVLHLTARPETLALRLAGRGRETADDIARRLARSVEPFAEGLDVRTVSNDGALSETIAQAHAALYPVKP